MIKRKVTSSTMAKIGRGEAVSMDVFGQIRTELERNIGDIVDFVKDNK